MKIILPQKNCQKNTLKSQYSSNTIFFAEKIILDLMKAMLLLFMMITFDEFLFAQHCPWDCSGMVMLQTNIPKDTFYKLNPVLADENKNELYDTVYGTGKDTWDECKFFML
jgi:hypothetical protein